MNKDFIARHRVNIKEADEMPKSINIPDGLVLSDMVEDFPTPSEPWDDFSDYDEKTNGDLKESTDDLTSRVLREARGKAQALRDYFSSTNEPTYQGFLDSEFSVVDGRAMDCPRSHYNYYARNNNIPEDMVTGFGPRGGTGAPPAPAKVWDESKASKDLLKIKNMFDSAVDTTSSLDEQVEMKFEKVYNLAYDIASKSVNSKHGLICGQAGIGKTYTVIKGVEAGIKKSGLEYLFAGGDVGKSISALVIFFYENRKGKLILLDDADAMLVVKDQNIKNALKRFLDPDNSVYRMSSTINDLVNRKRRVHESTEKKGIVIDSSRLDEGIVAYYDASGEKIIEESITPEQVAFFKKLEERTNNKKSDKKKILEKQLRTGIYSRVREADDDDVFDGEEGDDDGDGDDLIDNDEEIPISFEFKSRTIFVSNLNREELSDAVKSRMSIEEISLTNEEFMARLKQVLNTLDCNKDDAHSKDDVEWAKKVVYSLLLVLVEAYETGAKFGDRAVAIGGKLQFRLVPQLVDSLCSLAAKYRAATKISDRKKIEAALQMKFIKYYAIPALANLRDSKQTA